MGRSSLAMSLLSSEDPQLKLLNMGPSEQQTNGQPNRECVLWEAYLAEENDHPLCVYNSYSYWADNH